MELTNKQIYWKKYYQEHKEEIKLRKKEFYKKNKTKIEAQKKIYDQTTKRKKARRESEKIYYQDPINHERRRIFNQKYMRKRRALEKEKQSKNKITKKL